MFGSFSLSTAVGYSFYNVASFPPLYLTRLVLISPTLTFQKYERHCYTCFDGKPRFSKEKFTTMLNLAHLNINIK